MNNKTIRIISLIKKEFLIIFKDPKTRMLIILPPIMELFVFAYAITLEVRNIQLSVLDYSNGYYSHELVSRFYNSKWFKNIKYEKNIKTLKENIEINSTHAGIIIQNDFDKNIANKKTSEISVILDGRQTNSASIISGYISRILLDYSNEVEQKYNIKRLKVNTVTRNLYNQNIEYRWFLIVNLIVLLSMVICLLLSSLSIAREREMGTMNQTLVSPLSFNEILFAKLIPPFFVSFCLAVFITIIIIFLLKIPFFGNFILYLFALLISLLSLLGVGLFISSISYTQQMAILGVFAFQMPATLLSGFVSPVEDMPLFLQMVTKINPVYYFMRVVKSIYFKNAGFLTIIDDVLPMFLIAIITLLLARWSFKKQVE